MLQAVHGWSSTYERLVKSQKFFSSYLTQEDMSRLGRNYLQVGFYTEMLFPQKGVRFIAVNDNVDSANGGMDNDFTPLRNLSNGFQFLFQIRNNVAEMNVKNEITAFGKYRTVFSFCKT